MIAMTVVFSDCKVDSAFTEEERIIIMQAFNHMLKCLTLAVEICSRFMKLAPSNSNDPNFIGNKVTYKPIFKPGYDAMMELEELLCYARCPYHVLNIFDSRSHHICYYNEKAKSEMFGPANLIEPKHNDTRSRLYGMYPSHKYRPDCGYKIYPCSPYTGFPIFIGYQLLHFGHSLHKRAYILFLYYTEALMGTSDAPLIFMDIINEMEKEEARH